MKHFLWGFAFLFFSCGRESSPEPQEEKISFAPPQVTTLASLPDSVQPVTVALRDLPSPRKVQVPSRDGGSYSYVDEGGETHTFSLSPPVKRNLEVLKDESGETIKDYQGSPFLLGEGGLSQFKTYTTDDGLALDAVNCAILDSRGHLWFGTNGGGVSRYDGSTFTNFSSADGLAGNIIRSMLKDRQGRIWFGTISGVSSYDGHQFTDYSDHDGFSEYGVFSILEDKAGNIWFGTGGGGATRYDGKSFVDFTTSEGLADNFVLSMLEDKEGNLYFGTYGGGLSKYDGATFKNFTESDGLAGNRVRSLMLSKSGKIWIGTIGGGVSEFDGRVFTNHSNQDGLAGNIVRTIIEDAQGSTWFATETGITRYDGSRFTSYTRGQGLPANSVLHIVRDASGKLWFCTDGGGVSRFEGRSFTNFSSAQGLANNIVLSSLEDKRGILWFGTAGGGVSKFDGNTFLTYTTSQGLGGDIVISMLEDRTGNIWFGTGGGGVSKFDGDSFTTYTTAHSLGANEVYSIAEDHEGNLWFGTEGGGLSKFDGKAFTTYTSSHGLAGDVILSIEEDAENQLWMAAVDGGLSRFDGEKLTNFTSEQGLVHDAVVRIKEDILGNLWIGTEQGLSFIERQKLRSSEINENNDPLFLSFSTVDGLPDNLVQQIVPMKNGKIAVGTNQGFVAFDGPKEGVKFSKLENLEIFNSQTGYPVKDLTDGQNGMFQDSKGILWAGTGNNKTALVRFDYSQLTRNHNPPKVFLKQVRINEEVVSWNSLSKTSPHEVAVTEEITTYGKVLKETEREELRRKFNGISFDSVSGFYPLPKNLILPYAHNHINIDFGSDELAKPDLVEYQYILEGYDTEWSPVLRKTSATFGNILEGDYTFKVKARFTGPSEGNAGDWTEPIEFSFSVRPPIFRTWWAFLFYALLFLSLMYPVHRFQRNRAIREEKEKARERELEQARELEKAYTKLESAHEHLKATQNQLIQQEKLASLGQLTAGIAHEIKNPLNFVNNFSGLSLEFVEEIEEELDKLPESDPLENVRELLSDIRTNLTKIKHHGGRADGIVKSMLMHSRGGSGILEPTDINEVVKEYVNLSFHGMRANKHPINVDVVLQLQEHLPKVPLNTEDFSRVILNLTKNAFDAMGEKIKHQGPEYKAILKVRTKEVGGRILIEVEDNGPGVAEEIRDKLLMPFFTTKKGTEGTGLGLSITHDIIKAHNGTLDITSVVGEWTKFSIYLPKA